MFMFWILSILISLLLYWILFKPSKLALPGPRNWPIVGCVYQIDHIHAHVTFSKWALKYGAIFVANLYTMPVVFVNTYEAIYEVLVKRGDEFADRASNYRIDTISEKGKSLALAQYASPHRHVIRKAVQKYIKLYSTGTENTETIISNFIGKQMVKYASHSGKPFNIHKDILYFAQGVVYIIVFGEEVEQDGELSRLIFEFENNQNRNLTVGGSGMSLDLFPFLRYLGHPVYKELRRTVDLCNAVWERKKGMFMEDSSDNISDCVLKSLMKLARIPGSNVSETNVKQTMSDLMAAGSQTTSSSLSGLMALLLSHRDIQRELQCEVDTVVGCHNKVSLAVRDAMPYTRAVIYELLRYTSVVPLSLLHVATKDTTLEGYFLPKGTTICTNLWHLHHDQDFWGDPWAYRPERYLDDTGNLLPADHPNRKRLLAFGAGPRVCLGEVFALNRLFLYIASLVQKFDILPANEDELPTDDPRLYINGLVPYPKPFDVRLVPRS